MKTGGEETRKRIVMEALKLFTTKQYDQVTYCDLERATGLSRGAILYHIKNKEKLFLDAVEMFVFGNNTLTSLAPEQRTTLKATIDNFMDLLAAEQQSWRESGIENINFALVNIQMSAYTLFPESLKEAGQWYEREVETWREVIERAIATGEVRRVDARLMAEVLEDAYLGAAYAGLPRKTGYDVERVRAVLTGIYDTIKN